jgi:large-conductance mechanosensitive channel
MVSGQVLDISLIVSALITLAITILVIYFVFVVPINKFRYRRAFAAGPDEQLQLLTEIRDFLRETKN